MRIRRAGPAARPPIKRPIRETVRAIGGTRRPVRLPSRPLPQKPVRIPRPPIREHPVDVGALGGGFGGPRQIDPALLERLRAQLAGVQRPVGPFNMGGDVVPMDTGYQPSGYGAGGEGWQAQVAAGGPDPYAQDAAMAGPPQMPQAQPFQPKQIDPAVLAQIRQRMGGMIRPRVDQFQEAFDPIELMGAARGLRPQRWEGQLNQQALDRIFQRPPSRSTQFQMF